jgi:hypothetical protein
MICTQPPLEILKNRHCHFFAAGCVGWEREGRPHASLVIAGLDGNDNCTREKERGNSKMGLFFHAVLFCYCFLAFIFQCRLIDFLSRPSQLLDRFSCKISLLVVQIWWSSYYSLSSS